jgi:glucosyl-3-phosphoglycerate synthase
VIRTFDFRDFPLDGLRAAKAAAGATVSLCLPARDEESTVGEIVAAARAALPGLVDEVVVVDDGSSDRTAAAAARAGARVVRGSGTGGKGGALQEAVAAAAGDLLAFCDADLRDFDPGFVVGLLGPLLLHDDVQFVKAFYERTLDGRPRGGGRVTELTARPLIAVLFPHLSEIVQPLAGEFAARRPLLEALPFVEGYGVDLGLLVDAAAAVGTAGLAQVDLGIRAHRNRPLHELGPMATVIVQTALRRAGVAAPDDVVLRRPGPAGQQPVAYRERPPLVPPAPPPSPP